jgi:2-keto-4-pentenoate hydratase
MALNDSQVAQAADALFEAFRGRTTIPAIPEGAGPADAAEAVQVQAALLDRIGLAAAGYKAGFTNPPALEKAGANGPMSGVMFRDFTVASGGTLQRADIGTGALIEAEVAFRMGRDLAPRDGGYTDAEVLDAADSAIIAIEVAVPRLDNPLGQPMVHLAADNGAAMGFVHGPDIPDWRNRDLKALAIRLVFDGETVAEGLPLEARCDEVWSLAWTVNHFTGRGYTIWAGDYITTGAAAAPSALGETREVAARYDGVGEVGFSIAG